MKNELKMYVIEVRNKNTDEHYQEWQEAYNLQRAVDKVRSYIGHDEEIVEVFKVMRGWK